jgi:class 3 adenylate cyclase
MASTAAAQLQGQAKPGQIVVSQQVYEQAAVRFPNASGSSSISEVKSEPIAARIIDLSTPVAA